MPRIIMRKTVRTETTEEVIIETGPNRRVGVKLDCPCTEDELNTPIVVIPVRYPPLIQKNPYSIGPLFNQQPAKRQGIIRFK
jgi:hypothetical protein